MGNIPGSPNYGSGARPFQVWPLSSGSHPPVERLKEYVRRSGKMQPVRNCTCQCPQRLMDSMFGSIMQYEPADGIYGGSLDEEFMTHWQALVGLFAQ